MAYALAHVPGRSRSFNSVRALRDIPIEGARTNKDWKQLAFGQVLCLSCSTRDGKILSVRTSRSLLSKSLHPCLSYIIEKPQQRVASHKHSNGSSIHARDWYQGLTRWTKGVRVVRNANSFPLSRRGIV